MRISDWSSDVCSSDLETLMSDSQIMALRSNARQDYNMARYALGEFFKKFLELHPDQAVGSIVQAVEAYVARDHARNSEMLDAELQVDGRAVRLREDWSHIRSEEHTSELQSLMRISYAVFCLKKKIKT